MTILDFILIILAAAIGYTIYDFIVQPLIFTIMEYFDNRK